MQCVKQDKLNNFFYCVLKPALEGFFHGCLIQWVNIANNAYTIAKKFDGSDESFFFLVNDKIAASYQTNISPNSLNKAIQRQQQRTLKDC